MANFDIDISILRERMKVVSSFTPHKSPMPVLDNVKMEIADGGMKLSCTNLEIHIVTTTPVIHDESFALTVNAQDLSNFITNLTGNASVHFDGKRMALKCGTAKAAFPTVDANAFPILPPCTGSDFTISSGELLKSMGLVEFASLRGDDNRPILTCFNITAKDNELVLACTDGFRVAEVKTPIVFSGSENILVPVSHLAAFKKLSGDVHVIVGKNVTMFSSSNTTIYSVRMAGVFPLYNRIIPESFQNTISIQAIGWMKAILRRCLSFAPTIVELTVDQEGIMFLVETEEKGKYDEKLPISSHVFEEEYEYKLSLSPFMLLQTVETAESLGSELVMKWSSKRTPIMYTVAGVDNWLSVVMPMVRN